MTAADYPVGAVFANGGDRLVKIGPDRWQRSGFISATLTDRKAERVLAGMERVE